MFVGILKPIDYMFDTNFTLFAHKSRILLMPLIVLLLPP